ncbi:MAG: hypothetical protein CJBNEKGG_03168 [Prosthecobacter sp.]|nr:hypothetical protein [Prosthecobacter sp.]
MSNILIATPTYTIHRFLLPPHAPSVMKHEFEGGAAVLAGILQVRLNGKVSNIQGQLPHTGDECPDRYLTLAPFNPLPSDKKNLIPRTRYVRIAEKRDSQGLDATVCKLLSVSGSRIRRPVVIIGGTNVPDVWERHRRRLNADLSRPDTTVIIAAKNHASLVEHARKTRETKARHIIGQIDVGSLEPDFLIQMDTSYDRTVGDICRATRLSCDASDARFLLDIIVKDLLLDYLIIRIGNAACVVISKDPNNTSVPLIRLFYHPQRPAPTALPGLGSMIAYDLLVTSALAEKLATADSVDAAVTGAAHLATCATYGCFKKAFGEWPGDAKSEALEGLVKNDASGMFGGFLRDAEDEIEERQRKHRKKVREYAERRPTARPDSARDGGYPGALKKVDVLLATSPNKYWRMVLPDTEAPGGEGQAKLEDICHRLARDYLDDDPRAHLPIVSIGKLQLVDRLEVEDYLFLQRLLMTYHENSQWERPLSIGVFGQPGAGKSFGVKQLIEEMSGDAGLFAREDVTINMSQIRSLDELAESYHAIRDKCLAGPIPLVFFDEFDSTFEDKPFGWLKYFLAPMQDGEFIQNGKKYRFGKAIFVFAGGVNHSFSEFNERTRNPDFCSAKGPDFISRLRGILNIKGMNRPESGEHEHIYKLRRAVFLKWQLKERVGDMIEDKPQMHPLLADAFLSIPRFKHGVRSMEAILQMSSIEKGRQFVHRHLPPRDQLDMHVDARTFLAIAGVSTPIASP